MERIPFLQRVFIPNKKLVEQDNNKILLVSNKSGLFLDGNDLEKNANMYDRSINNFVDMISSFLTLNEVNEFNVIEKKSREHQLIVDSINYEKIKRMIFEFAYIACSDLATGDHIFTAVNYAPLLEAMKKSIELVKRRRMHAIFSPRNDIYSIVVASKQTNDEEFENRYALMKKI